MVSIFAALDSTKNSTIPLHRAYRPQPRQWNQHERPHAPTKPTIRSTLNNDHHQAPPPHNLASKARGSNELPRTTFNGALQRRGLPLPPAKGNSLGWRSTDRNLRVNPTIPSRYCTPGRKWQSLVQPHPIAPKNINESLIRNGNRRVRP